VIVRDPAGTVADFLEMVRLLNLTGVSHAVGYKAWLDIGPEGISKGYALDKLAAELGVDPASCLAIGDGRNDIEMLTWAGRGVAMGQAPAEVKAAADAITGPVWEHGAATELHRWF
jgi:hydroxymethylpyrimidine pyrophosphatase-like HAD family hydrolase